MIKLETSEKNYYQEKYENNGFIITPLTDHSVLIWKGDDMIKCVRTLKEAEEYTNKIK